MSILKRFHTTYNARFMAALVACTLLAVGSQSNITHAMLPSSSSGVAVYLPLVRQTFPPCNDIEDNDTPGEAQSLTSIGATCTGSFEDDAEKEDDYYHVTLKAGQVVTLALTGIPGGADYDLSVYPEGGTEAVVYSNQHGQADERISYTVPAAGAGAYLVRLTMYVKSTTTINNYMLTATVE